jgi:O-antigen ligase
MPIAFKEQVFRRYPSTQGLSEVLNSTIDGILDHVVFAIWMALLAFGVLAFGAVEPWSLATLEIGSALLALAWLITGIHVGNLRVRLLPIFIPAAFFFALIMVQIFAHTTAYEFETSRAAYLFVTIGLIMFMGAQVLNSESRFRVFYLAATLFGVSVALLAILQSVTSPNEIYWTVVPRFGDGVFGPYVNHSHFAGLMEMLMPFPFLLADARVLPAGRRGLGYFAGALMAGSIFVSGSRGGIVAASVQLFVIYFLFRKKSSLHSVSWHKHEKWVSAAAILVVVGVVFWLGGQEMVTRISSIKDPFGNTVGATRLLIFKDCYRMIAGHPLMGWGAGSFQTVYPAFRSFSTDVIVNAAHNDYLQLLVEFGVAGATIAVFFLAISYRYVGRLSRDWRDSWPALASFGALLGTVGILIHSLTDFNLQIPANAAIFYVFCMIASLPVTTPVLRLKDDATKLGVGSANGNGRRGKRR